MSRSAARASIILPLRHWFACCLLLLLSSGAFAAGDTITKYVDVWQYGEFVSVAWTTTCSNEPFSGFAITTLLCRDNVASSPTRSGSASISTSAIGTLGMLKFQGSSGVICGQVSSGLPTHCWSHSYNGQSTTTLTYQGIKTDTDRDVFIDSYDNCPTLSQSNQWNHDTDAQGDACDDDDDNDGLLDGSDNCRVIVNVDQLNTDGDTYGNACDGDDDNDGVGDTIDKFPLDANESVDTDNDGTGNNADADDDNDTVDDGIDNCPLNANTNQLNNDGDAQGDVCDTDDDNDGVADTSDKFRLNPAADSDADNDGFPGGWNPVCDVNCQNNSGLTLDNCPSTANISQANFDGDSQGDACDADDDNDGVADLSDKFPLNTAAWSDSDSDGFPDAWGASCNLECQNSSGLIIDNCPLQSNPSQFDADGDSQGDACDFDNDNDGLSDTDEAALGNDPLNSLDPPKVAIGSSYIFAVDQHIAAASASVTLWNSADGVLEGFCDDCFPSVTDMIMSSSGDVCNVSANGVNCLWWGMDTGPVYGDEMLPVQIAGQAYTPLHDWDGMLKYVDESSVLHHLATDAFRISGDYTSHACIVSKTLGVYCWASHSGTDIVSSNVPVALQNVSTVKDVAVGANHACAINNGAVQCWGDAAGNKTAVPAVVDTPLKIAAGADHTCAINVNRTVSCWGDNSEGQLGDNNADGYVDGVNVAQRIAAGTHHTCAVTGNYAMPSSLRVTCWGSNSVGQTTVPPDLTSGVEHPVNVVAAGNQTCAVKAGQNAAASALLCWPVDVFHQ
jgi:hypothetical protein